MPFMLPARHAFKKYSGLKKASNSKLKTSNTIYKGGGTDCNS